MSRTEGKSNGRWEEDGGEPAEWPDSAGDIHWAEGKRCCPLLNPTSLRLNLQQFKNTSPWQR